VLCKWAKGPHRWRQQVGGLKAEQVKRLKDLELENSRLRKAVSDLTLRSLPELPPAE
jgi:putative transposase